MAKVLSVDPKPARRLRLEVARQRDLGAKFEDAWPAAVAKACGDRWWMVAWDWSRAEWQACYERRPQSAQGNFLEQLTLPTVAAGYSASPDDLTAA
jgi:hypothetical protein